MMKKATQLLIGLGIAGAVLTGCKEAKEILNIKFNADYQTEFDIVVPPSKGANIEINGVFEVNETIDPASNPNFELYINKIQEISINEVQGEVLSISKNLLLETAVISVTNENHIAKWEFTNEPVTVGTILTLDNNTGQWDAIENILLDKKVLTVSITGKVDVDNVDFEVRFSFKSEVIANPLD